ncbi:hypothetical protein SUGI_1170010 [Cryptomeria japonica]|nr:hypothetical protein SUGI_1170010 [Cryptomeria japonica]
MLAAKGGNVEVSVRAKANGPRVSSAISLRALPSSRVDVGSAPIPGGSHATMLLKEAPVAAPCKPKTPVTNTEGSDSMHSAPSGSDRATCGLGPLTVPVCKPLAFRVFDDTDQEIIHNSSVFESHGLIYREKFNRLIGLLQSRIVDNSLGMEHYDVKMREDLNGRNEPNRVQIAETQRWQDERKKAREEKDNLYCGNGLFSDALSPSVTGNVSRHILLVLSIV